MDGGTLRGQGGRIQQLGIKMHQLGLRVNITEELCNLAGTLGSLLAQGSDGAALCGAEGANNEGREADGIMAPGLADTVLGIRRLIYGPEATDLVLDINTAHNRVSVSGDRKSASYSLTELHYPQSPERFQLYAQALSSRSFPSGRHYWEVEVSESGKWEVGAAYPSIERGGGQSCIGYNNKSWGLWADNRYSVRHDSKCTQLPHVPSCRRIGIWLDYEAGRLSFYELSEPIRHLHTFTASFTEPLHAAFWVRGEGTWVRIIRETKKGAEVLTPETQKDSEDLTPGREKLDPETRMQEKAAVSHIIHKGETEREELAGQIPDMEELCNLAGTLGSLLAQGSDGAALCGAEGADNEGREADGIMAPGLADTVLGIRRLIYGQEATDLVLDINTAHNRVSVSGDRKSASNSLTELHYPQSSERFQLYAQTLSSRSFPSGRHYWEVEGSESGGWGVGAAYPSIERGGWQSGIGNNNKSWCLYRWNNNKYSVEHDSKWTDLPHISSCRRIRIWLDYEAGRLSFYELSEPIRHLHTFTASFTEPLHAAFWVWGEGTWVRIIS
uniref:B30.2/SPRY domain-containing protein n=1 Tax=Xenopus tropicalis TaxID=8364 RepID=A0A6I8SD68_XENTR